MKRNVLVGLAATTCLAAPAAAVDIYMLSSGDTATDNAAVAALAAHGHEVTIGVQYMQFDGTVSLTGYDTVLLQANYNWAQGVMPDPGQQQLVDWVMAGGRLVTTEWVIYYTNTFGGFQIVGTVMPFNPGTLYGSTLSTTFSLVTPDAEVDAGVPASFTSPLTSYTGTEGFYTPKPGATVHYNTANGGGRAALASWSQGAGRVFSFTSTCGPDQVGNADFARLYANVMGTGSCPADWNGDTTVNSADISAFLTAWLGSVQGGTLVADFNGDNSVNSTDISAFLTAWLAAVQGGC